MRILGRAAWLLVATTSGLAGATWAEEARPDLPDSVAFRLPDDAGVRHHVAKSAGWLVGHVATISRPVEDDRLRVIAWKDPTLAPEDPNRLAGYLITDALWASRALRPFDPDAAGAMERSLHALGWPGNGLHEVLFHPVDRMLHRPDDADFVHGRSLGVFAIDGGRSVDVRVLGQRWDPDFEAGHPRLFAEHAAYQALHEFWKGDEAAARRRILGIVRDDRATDRDDRIFWDGEAGILVDQAGREDWHRFQRGERPTGRHASFKLGVLLYAIRLTGVEAEVGPPLEGMKRRLWSARREDGGVAHFVEVRRGGQGEPARSGATGEATAIAILSETIQPAVSRRPPR
ncbi:hypothetical protein [Paludisphaera mucosa]|uniref:Uncharacterized protein n=1 Tax=Paludisphaera mucosa TaxID=3030827 RepID=A0ABT6FHZ8_9BACT|nr:hypothetical protein [Paludisphaera mucosa]MDG3007003.1 hypothetical protein [Paludisphaera mucosa]